MKQVVDAMPSWFWKAVIGTGITLLAGGAGGWIGHVNNGIAETGRVSVEVANIKDDLKDLKPTIRSLSDNVHELNGRLSNEKQPVRYIYVPRPAPKPAPKTDQEVLNGQ